MTYSFEKIINSDSLTKELMLASLMPSAINTVGNQVFIVFPSELTQSQVETLNSLVAAHNPNAQLEAIKNVVRAATSFGQSIIIDFAAENVALGITQAGKTKAVADYLANMTRYAQTGSLYEVLAEIDRLEQAGLPQDLVPFVTAARLQIFRTKITSYLQS